MNLRGVKILDLFSGLEGWTEYARDCGAEVCTWDIAAEFGADIQADILEPSAAELIPWQPDIVVASPPCEAFSVLQIGRNWTGPKDVPAHSPKTEAARVAVRIVERTLLLIELLQPFFWLMENPMAKLRKLPVVAGVERRSVTYCQYGFPFRKPTDLWGGFPPSLVLRQQCAQGKPCHVSAPRGSRTGIHGDLTLMSGYLDAERARRRAAFEAEGRMSFWKRQYREAMGTSSPAKLAALRAKIPHELSRDVLTACAADLPNATRQGVQRHLQGQML